MPQSPFDTPETRQKNRRRLYRLAAALGVGLAVVAGGTWAALHYTDPFREWPATGTVAQSPTGDAPFHANAIIAVTCGTDGQPRITQKMLVKPRNKYEKGRLPSWSIALFVPYAPNSPDLCTVFWKPYSDGVKVETRTLEYHVNQKTSGKKEWASVGTLNFTGMQSLEAEAGSRDIAVLLINFTELPQGPLIKYGQNGILAPPKDLIKS